MSYLRIIFILKIIYLFNHWCIFGVATYSTVVATAKSDVVKSAAEYINAWAAGAGRSSAFNEFELNSNRMELERGISECDEYIRERLSFIMIHLSIAIPS
ncbi:MAG: hypothetical protein SOS93_05850 [Mannheimia varigena]|nr:hypothetical protein [Mannheimia varigena]